MKKYILIFGLCLLMLTGCGNKSKLVCSKSEKNAGYDYYDEYNLIYENGSVSQIILKMEAIFDEHYTDEEIDEQYDKIAEECHMYEVSSLGSIKCKVVKKDDKIEFEQKINVKKIDDKLFEKFFNLTKDDISNRDNIEKILSNVGYNCK